MRLSRRVLLKTIVAIILTSVLVILFLPSSQEGGSRDREADEVAPRSRSQRGHDSNETQKSNRFSQQTFDEVFNFLLKNSDDHDALFDAARAIADSSHSDDRRLLSFFIRAKIGPEHCAEIIGYWKGNSHGGAYLLESFVRQIATNKDYEWALTLGGGLSDEKQRDDFWKKIGEATDFFSPEKFEASIKLLPPEDKTKVVEGIVEFFEAAKFEDQQRLIKQYYEITSDPSVLGPMTGPLVSEWSKVNPGEAVDWLLNSPPEIAKFGDRDLIKNLSSDSVDLADSFVNQLYAKGQTKRASTVVSAMADTFFKRNPAEAIEWISKQPPLIENRQYLLTNKLSKLGRQDWEAAQKLVLRLDDAEVTKAFRIVEKSIKGQ